MRNICRYTMICLVLCASATAELKQDLPLVVDFEVRVDPDKLKGILDRILILENMDEKAQIEIVP